MTETLRIWLRRAPPSRYALTAAALFLLHNLIMIAADAMGATMFQAAATAFVLMVVIGYMALSAWAIPAPRSWARFWRYTGAMALGFPVSTAFLWLFFKGLEQPMAVAAPAATLAMVAVNYLWSAWAIVGETR